LNAGFDETSQIIKQKYPDCDLLICDFYDPIHHTEASIKRARQAYPPSKDTIQVESTYLPFPDNSFDYSLAILSAHEIRNEEQRIHFFDELYRITKPNGQVLVTEHLRDFNNFLAYTIGFLHFHSKGSWLKTFTEAKFDLTKTIRTTPFISTFILEKYGDTD
jgi:ubiquinone/menaquinone biosynthesis C-methylase UbiE